MVKLALESLDQWLSSLLYQCPGWPSQSSLTFNFGRSARTLYLLKSLCRSTERAADHEAKRQEQIAKGLLERQKLLNKKEAEESRKTLAELKAITAAVESTGQSKAEAQVCMWKEMGGKRGRNIVGKEGGGEE